MEHNKMNVLKIDRNISKFIFLLAVIVLCSCEQKIEKKDVKIEVPVTQTPVPKEIIRTPDFNPDSAYYFIEKQVKFGPRVPNTDAHKKCALFFEQKLKSYDFHVIIQEGEVTAFNNKKLSIKNVIAQYDPENKERIMLFAHWDSRPFADRDTKDRNKPIDGANDGASGVGVLLEIARLIQSFEEKPKIGIDILFFDAEDYGQPQESMVTSDTDSWCLGSQYWAKNPPIPDYKARFGILLDMVGAINAEFPKESSSMYFAPSVVNKVWAAADRLGYSNYFVNKREMRGITDDHVYVNTLAKIPSIDIIHYRTREADFGEFHHTHRDTMDIIDKNTLKAVGQTLIDVIYRER